MDALLGNVFRHTPEGTAFTVTLHQGPGTVGILIADAGPGIPDPETALRRGASGAGSTGLGLDIARQLAESSGGAMRIDASSRRRQGAALVPHGPARPPSARDPAAGLQPLVNQERDALKILVSGFHDVFHNGNVAPERSEALRSRSEARPWGCGGEAPASGARGSSPV
ncbi:sensor histidine kinase [Streptosporangium lutulentum]